MDSCRCWSMLLEACCGGVHGVAAAWLSMCIAGMVDSGATGVGLATAIWVRGVGALVRGTIISWWHLPNNYYTPGAMCKVFCPTSPAIWLSSNRYLILTMRYTKCTLFKVSWISRLTEQNSWQPVHMHAPLHPSTCIAMTVGISCGTGSTRWWSLFGCSQRQHIFGLTRSCWNEFWYISIDFWTT